MSRANLSAIEVKFLLKLLAFPEYKTRISQIKPNSATKPPDRDKVCRQLCSYNLLAKVEPITHLRLSKQGRTALQLGEQLTEIDRQVLESCKTSEITIGQTKLPVEKRQITVQNLAKRGLVEIKTQIQEVWLTAEGRDYLTYDFKPAGTYLVGTARDLSNYASFLRQSFLDKSSSTLEASVPSDEEVLQAIEQLDAQLSTGNYLPIFHLRDRLQSRMSRQELDAAVFRLQKAERLHLSTVTAREDYTNQQLNAGIPQKSGGALFFISIGTETEDNLPI